MGIPLQRPRNETRTGPLLTRALILWGNVLTPTWFYQGARRMPVLAASLLVTRVLLLVPLFLLVKTGDDVVAAAALQFSPTLLSVAILTGALFWKRKVSFGFRISLQDMLVEMKEAHPIFFSSALTSIYMYANVVFFCAPSRVTPVAAITWRRRSSPRRCARSPDRRSRPSFRKCVSYTKEGT